MNENKKPEPASHSILLIEDSPSLAANLFII